MLNEGKLAPQAMETAPALQAGQMASSSVGGGTAIRGAAQPTIAVGAKLDEGVAATQGWGNTAQQSFTRSVDEIFSEGSAYSKAWGLDRQNAKYAAAEAGMDSAMRFARAENLNLANAAAYRESLSEEERRSFDIAAGAGLSKGLTGRVGWSSQEIEAFSRVGERGQQVIEQLSRQADESFGMKTAYMSGVKDSVTSSLSERGETKLANTASESLGSSLSEARRAEVGVKLDAEQVAAIQTEQKMELGTFVENWKASSGSNSEFAQDVSRTVANIPADLQDEYQAILRAQQQGRNGFVGSPVENQAAAAALTLTTFANMRDGDSMSQMLDVVKKGSGLGASTVGTFDAAGVFDRVEAASKEIQFGNPALDRARDLTGPEGNKGLVNSLVGGGFSNVGSIVPGANFDPEITLSSGREAATRALENFGVTPETAASGNWNRIRSEAKTDLSARTFNANAGMDFVKDVEFGTVEKNVRNKYGEVATANSGWAYNELTNHMAKNAALATNPDTPQVARDAALLELAKAEAARSYLPTGSAGYGLRMKEEGLYVAGDRDSSVSNFWSWRSENPAEAQHFRARAMYAEKDLYGDNPSARMPFTQEIGSKVLGMMSR
ncbi:MAG: hypothetical protein DDT34_02027 [Firmicutes bacterium]|nr:hypothetical protein [Bacillota bacterium]